MPVIKINNMLYTIYLFNFYLSINILTSITFCFSDNTNYTADTSNSSINLCITYTNNENKNHDEHRNICCILDCVNSLMILHRDTFIDENNHQKLKEIQDSCTSCLVKLLKFYKVIIFT